MHGRTRMKYYGSYFRKADLHIHTPVSTCYSADEKKVTAKEIVDEAEGKGLEIIGITDHNDIAAIDEIRTEAGKRGITVFPGIEVSTQEAHLLAFFDCDYPSEKLEEFLPVIGINKEDRGKKHAMAKSFERVIEIIKTYGGIAIAAHANSKEDGILSSVRKGTYKKQICKNPYLYALEFNQQNNKEYIDRFTCGKVPGYPAKACVCGSDAHCISEIGQRYTYLKMDTLNLNGLQQALYDWSVKVRHPWNTIRHEYPRIESITVNQGFFKDIVFPFHPNLTCLVGGTATGKSTIIEFCRYCYNDISAFQEISNDTYEKVEKLIGAGGKITIECITDNGDTIYISREVSDPRRRDEVYQTVTDKDGFEALMPPKPTFYSQGEINRIAMNPIAQLNLIDNHIDISEENLQEEEVISELETNAAQLQETVERLRALYDIIKDPETGTIAIQKERDRLRRQLKNPIFLEFPKWELEGRFIDQTLKGVDTSQQTVKELIGKMNLEEHFPLKLDDSSPNFNLLKPLNDVSDTVHSRINKLVKVFESDITKIKAAIIKLQQKWQPLFTKKKDDYEQFLSQLGEEDVNKAQRRLRILDEQLEALKQKERTAKTLAKKEIEIWGKREELRSQLKSIRKNRFNKRVQKSQEWEDKLGGKIKIEVKENRDLSEYHKELIKITTGSGAHKTSVSDIALSIEPWDLVGAVLSNDTSRIQNIADTSDVDVEKIVDFLKFKSLTELLSIETVTMSDLPVISFEQEPGRFKPINELAGGTKSIVIVSLAMIEGRTPLIIDQPEDSLNTEFIYGQIVNKLREEKEYRQFILTSHNANIVVAGETDLTHVLTATFDRGSIRSSGGIDDSETNELLLIHLEGGKDAFDLRTQKYKQSMA